MYRFLLFIGLIELILALVHYFLYKSLIHFFQISNPSIILSLKIFFSFLAISFVSANIIASNYYNFFTRSFYYFSTSWLNFLNFILLSCIILWLIVAISNTFHWQIKLPFISTILFSLAILLGIYAIINASIIRTSEYEISLKNLPNSWKGKTAVWISDLHLGQIYTEKFSQKISEKIQKINPEIVFIGGDLFDGQKTDIKKAIQPFKNINPQHGIYFVTGNHEEYGDENIYLEEIENVGIKLLNNQKTDINGLQILGVNYNQSRNIEEFEKIIKDLNINQDYPSILLKHSPHDLNIAEQSGIDLQISGHTHKAQLFPWQIFTHKIYKGYDYGLKNYKTMQVLVSSGTGTWGPPARLNSKSELLIIKFN